MEYPLALLVHASVPFSRQRPRSDAVSTEGDGIDDEAQILLRRGGASARCAIASLRSRAPERLQPRAARGASRPADAAVTFQSAVGDQTPRPGTACGELAVRRATTTRWPTTRISSASSCSAASAAASGPHFGDLWEWDATQGHLERSARRRGAARHARPTIGRGTRWSTTPSARRRSCSAAGSRAPASTSPISGSGTAPRDLDQARGHRRRQPTPRFGASMVWDSGRNARRAVRRLRRRDRPAVQRHLGVGRRDGTWTERTPAGHEADAALTAR